MPGCAPGEPVFRVDPDTLRQITRPGDAASLRDCPLLRRCATTAPSPARERIDGAGVVPQPSTAHSPAQEAKEARAFADPLSVRLRLRRAYTRTEQPQDGPGRRTAPQARDVGPWRRAARFPHPFCMTTAEAQLHELSREECLALLPTVPVGRLVFTERALPAVVPVNFVLSCGRIVIRTGASSSLAAAVRGAVVAFQVDDFDAQARHGWSVTVTGRAAEVTDPGELARAAELPLMPWVGGQLDHVIVVPVELVNGRRVGPALTTRAAWTGAR